MPRQDTGATPQQRHPTRQAFREFDMKSPEDSIWCGREELFFDSAYTQRVWNSGHVTMCCLSKADGTYTAVDGSVYELTDDCIFIRPASGQHTLNLAAGSTFTNTWISVPEWLWDSMCKSDIVHPATGPVFRHNAMDYICNAILELLKELEMQQGNTLGNMALKAQQIFNDAYNLGMLNSADERIVHLAKKMLGENLAEKIKMQDIAKKCNCGYSRFRQLFRKSTGHSPGVYRIMLRMEKARQKLIAEGLEIKQVAYELGYPDVQTFSRQFKTFTGSTPKSFQRRNPGRGAH